jgi:FemAB-related protein (PEP-CTERM system-associated)
MTVRLLSLDADNPGLESAWDQFVLAHPEGTFFHRAAWRRVIARAFGHATHYVAAERDGAITGVLPLARIRTLLFGDSLISVPFCVNGGPLAADAESFAALAAHAESVMQQAGVKVLEFRFLHAVPADWLSPTDWPEKEGLYVIFRKPISADDDANMKAIPRKQRAMVRKGINLGLTSEIDRTTARLHPIYAESVRNLGTPVFAQRYFDILLEEFGESADIVTIIDPGLDGGTPIASVLNFYFRDEVLPYYGGGRAIARDRYGNDFMYWEVMRRAAARGARLFDYGRSKTGTGAYAFKKNWGFEPAPLHYRFRLAPGATIPDINPLNPKYRLFIAAWKKLPLPVANLIGPHIVRGLG